jgi:hypothetical protein
MESRATKRGLMDPGRFLADEFNREKREITRFEMLQQRLQIRPRDRLSIEEEEEEQEAEDQMEEDAAEDVVPRRLGRLNLQEFIRYE